MRGGTAVLSADYDAIHRERESEGWLAAMSEGGCTACFSANGVCVHVWPVHVRWAGVVC